MEKIEIEALKGYWRSYQTLPDSDFAVEICIKTNATRNYIIAMVVSYENKNIGEDGITREEAPVEIIPHPELEEEYCLKIGETEHFIKSFSGKHISLEWGVVDISFKKITDFD